MTEFVPITRYSRCKRYSGATIKCPDCNTTKTIYHLSWSALTCQKCKAMIDKYDWFIEKGKHSKKEVQNDCLPKITDDEFQFIALAIEYWQEKEELINPSIDYVVDVPKLIQKLSDMASNNS